MSFGYRNKFGLLLLCYCAHSTLNRVHTVKAFVKMGRNSDQKVRVFYQYCADIDKSKCNICDTLLKGTHITNLRRHLMVKHRNVFENTDRESNAQNEVERKKVKISYEINNKDFIASIVKIVTSDGRPFVHLDSEGFRDIVSPIYNALSIAPITSHNIMDFVRAKEQSIKAEIKNLVKGNLVALKIDVASRMDRSILGVNLQLIDPKLEKAEISIKTLGMVHVSHSHTGMYIKEKICDIIHEYDMKLEHIHR